MKTYQEVREVTTLNVVKSLFSSFSSACPFISNLQTHLAVACVMATPSRLVVGWRGDGLPQLSSLWYYMY